VPLVAVRESRFGPQRRFAAARRCVCSQGRTRRSDGAADSAVPDPGATKGEIVRSDKAPLASHLRH
jgi:hypothetical protein